ncbi:proton-conducting transporter membrane subunit [Pseudarthrobacter sp. NIBRBAC000502771]|uniref:proton-conducting transporter transmembrane domain-containing protein n=1 Tax=Pseudarthrobacter sp. NIBRBAC000502771 TaxID=2590774 RepID=UPI00113144A0|nr:proton-conducting transporter membrane subunit [Pseudarthrobacter sp. NIBRBAC000502771]QDG63760.1 NADH-quinone oxidoreductase subunit L [Pseudarthrobacter sp. NIBRBAC000502771]
MSWLLILLIGIPAGAGTALAVAGRKADRVAPLVSVAISVLVLVAASAAAALRPALWVRFLAGAGFGLDVDDLSALLLPAVAAVAFLVLVYAAAADIAGPARFHGLMLVFIAAVLVTLTATTLPALLFAWEVMGAASYALIGFHWRQSHRVSSGLTAFIATRTADLGLYLAAGAAMAGAGMSGAGASGGGMSLAGLDGLPGPWRDVAAGGILVAALGKAAQLPFSFWLSRAMDGPSAVSALLHSAAMVAMGGYLLLRVQPLLAASGWAADAAAWAGAATAVVLGLIAVGQEDLKQLLAASTSAQLGLVTMAAGVGDAAGGAAHLMAHAATKSALFLAAGAWLAALGTKRLADLRGAGRRWPLLGASFTLAVLALAGIPPLSLWATKDNVLTAAREHSLPLYLAGLAGAVLAAAYAAKAAALIWKPVLPGTSAGYDSEEKGSRTVARWQQVPVTLLAVAAALSGLLVLGTVGDVVRGMLGSGARSSLPELALSGLLALAVLITVWKFGGSLPSIPGALSWLQMERAAHFLLVRPVLATATHLARFDDAILARAAGGSAELTRRSAHGLNAVDTALDSATDAMAGATAGAAGRSAITDEAIDGAVSTLARSVRAAGRAARRPQSGQLHHYYAQAAIVIIVAAVLLIVVR